MSQTALPRGVASPALRNDFEGRTERGRGNHAVLRGVAMTSRAELLKATTQKELRILASAWGDRVTEGPWIIKLGYSPERVIRTNEGYEIYMEAEL